VLRERTSDLLGPGSCKTQRARKGFPRLSEAVQTPQRACEQVRVLAPSPLIYGEHDLGSKPCWRDRNLREHANSWRGEAVLPVLNQFLQHGVWHLVRGASSDAGAGSDPAKQHGRG
jgi:hypothetical protein